MNNQIINAITDNFIKNNLKFSIIFGLIILILFISLICSFILLFFYDGWWKLTISSFGLLWCMKKIIEHKAQNWINEQINNKNGLQ